MISRLIREDSLNAERSRQQLIGSIGSVEEVRGSELGEPHQSLIDRSIHNDRTSQRFVEFSDRGGVDHAGMRHGRQRDIRRPRRDGDGMMIVRSDVLLFWGTVVVLRVRVVMVGRRFMIQRAVLLVMRDHLAVVFPSRSVMMRTSVVIL